MAKPARTTNAPWPQATGEHRRLSRWMKRCCKGILAIAGILIISAVIFAAC